jgi:glycosyltransferase involved in cell wall biosynthesis
MKVSILISSYNGGTDVPALLDSIEKLALGSHELEVILRDDHSSDGTLEKEISGS